MADFRENNISAQDGTRLYCRDYGDPLGLRTPVLCLSGLTRNSADFADVAARLAPERRVLCPDYRGRGRSAYDPDWSHYDALTYLNDVAHQLAAAGIERTVVIGTSLGGLVAMGLAVLRPSLVAAIVLNDVGPELSNSGLARILEYSGKDHPQPDWDVAIAFLKQLLPRLAPKADDVWWRKMAEATYRRGDDGMLHFNWDVNLVKPIAAGTQFMPNLWTLYRGLRRIPALALHGALSDVLTDDVFNRMAAEKPDLVRVTVPDVGHTPSFSEPQSLQALDAFLARL